VSGAIRTNIFVRASHTQQKDLMLPEAFRCVTRLDTPHHTPPTPQQGPSIANKHQFFFLNQLTNQQTRTRKLYVVVGIVVDVILFILLWKQCIITVIVVVAARRTLPEGAVPVVPFNNHN
jgi:hypothetical protein